MDTLIWVVIPVVIICIAEIFTFVFKGVHKAFII